MPYESGAAFRRALEDRLRNQSLASGQPLVRLRKMVAFERFLARLVVDQPDLWVLKGGLSLQLRLGERARTTQDIDLEFTAPPSPVDVHQALVHSALLDLQDWFSFEVARPTGTSPGRFAVHSSLDGRLFESFHVDVGSDDPLTQRPEMLRPPPLLEFAGIPAPAIPCYPVPQQIAEKVHACASSYGIGGSSRIKDRVDILLLAQMGSLEADVMQEALRATFAARQTPTLPSRLPPPPAGWARSFLRLCKQVGLEYQTLEQADEAMRLFLDPLLGSLPVHRWHSDHWAWD